MKTTEEKNKLIAELMGIRYEEDKNYHESSDYYYEDIELEYHSSWDWLMPVVDTIKSKLVEEYTLIDKIDDALISVEIQAVYDACVEFIEWHNENQ